MTVKNQWNNKSLYRNFHDTTSGEEIIDSNLALHGDSRFDDLKYIINDFSEVKHFTVTDIDISLIANIDNVGVLSNRRLKIAIVATDKALLAWVDLYCKRMDTSPYQCKIFHNVDETHVELTLEPSEQVSGICEFILFLHIIL